MAANFKNILITKPSSLGDIVMALPALTFLRRNFPDARISWLVRPEFAGFLENHPHLDEIIIFDRKELGKAWWNFGAFKALVGLIRQLRAAEFDAVFDLQGLFRTACLGRLSGCKNRFGMADAREFAGIFYTRRVKPTDDKGHMVDYYLKVVEAAGVSGAEAEFVIPEDAGAVDSVKKLLASQNVDSDNYAVFIPCSRHDDKCWPVERFAALAGKIVSDFGLSVTATGSASEKADIEVLGNMAEAPVVNLAGLTNLKELIELLRGAKLIVSNDTGPGHIAAVLGRPCVFIFGCSNPARVGPYGMADSIVAIEPNGRGSEFKSRDPKYDIKLVTPEEVYKKVCEKI